MTPTPKRDDWTAAKPPPRVPPSAGPELLSLLCLAVVLIVTVMGMLGPLLLQLAEEFDVSVAQAGLLASATALPWAIAAPIVGPLSDRFGRRRMLAASLLGLGAATCLSALVHSFALLAAVRILSGVLAAPGPTSVMAAVGDHFPANRRASAIGWVNAGFGISALAGVPALGAVGGLLGWRAAFLAAGLGTVLLAILVWWRLPGEAAPRAAGDGLAGAYRAILSARGLRPILLGNVLERAVFATFGLYLAPFLMQTYAIDPLQVAPLLAVIAVGTIVGNVLGGRLADAAARPTIYALGQLASAVFALAYFLWSPGLLASALVGLAFGLATAASRPAIMAMASGLSNEHRGTALGIFSFTNQAGWAFGPAFAGLGFLLGGYPAIGILCGLAATAAAIAMFALHPRP